MSRTYARLDQATLGPQLLLEQGGLLVTFDTDGASLNRNARSNQGVDIGLHYWEVIVGGDLPLSGNVSAGIVDEAVATNTQVGDVTDSFGYQAGDGLMLAEGSTDATVAEASAQDVIGFALDVDAVTPTLSVYLNRLLLHTFSLPTGKTWHPAVSIGGETALELSVFVNLGRREFENSPPEDYRPGIFIEDAGISLRIAPEGQDYLTRPDDEPPNTRYEGRIINPRSFVFKTGARPWTHAARGQTASFSDLDLDNRDGRYDTLLADPPRGSRVVLRRIVAGELLATADSTLVAILDDVTAPSRTVIRLHLRSILTGYKVPLRRQIYTPFVADGAANRVKPISLGACRNVAGILVDPIARRYEVHDAPLTQIAMVRDKGDPLDPQAVPPDYVPTADLRGIQVETEPVGKLTLDVSSQGASALTPPSLDDALDGYGDMATDTGGMPTRWIVRNSTAHMSISRVATDGGRLELRASGIPSSQTEGWTVQYEDQSTSRNFIPIRKDVRYRLTLSIPATRWPTLAATLDYLFASLAGPSLTGVDVTRQLLWSVSSVPSVGTFTAAFQADRDGTFELFGQLTYDTARSSETGWIALPWWITLDDITVEAITTVPQDIIEGYGQMLAGLDRWVDDGSSDTGSYTQVDQVTGSYTMGTMRLSVDAGTGEFMRVRYDDGTANDALITGNIYRVALLSPGTTSNSTLRIICKDGSVDTVLAEFTGAGTFEETFTVTGGDGKLILEMDTDDSDAGDFYIAYLRILDITAQEAEGVQTDDLAGITLADYFEEILVNRHGLDASSYNVADLEAIDAATGYVFGVHIPDAINVDDALWMPLDSFGGCLSDGGDGEIRTARLINPEDASDDDIEFEFTRTNMLGAPEPQSAVAQGLTTNFGCRRNWTVFTLTDFVDDFDPVTGIDAATRERFKRLSQYLVSASTDLHPMYRDAQDAGELHTLLDQVVHAQSEADRIAAIFAICRRLYVLKAKTFGAAPPALRFGSIVKCTYPRYGFDEGKKLIVFDAERALFGNRIGVLALC